MAGSLLLAGDPETPTAAATKNYVDMLFAVGLPPGGPFLPLAGNATVWGPTTFTGATTMAGVTSGAHVIPASGGLQGTTWLNVGNNKNLTNAGAVSPIFSANIGTISGTLSGSIPAFSLISNGADTANATSSNQPVLLRVAQAYGGAGMKGGRAAATFQSSLTATSSNAPTVNPFYTVLNAWLTMQATDGGTAPTLAGGIGQAICFNPQVVFGATATNFLEATVMELDTALASGSSVARKFGVKIAQLAADQTQGSVSDAGLKFGGAGTVGWKVGILFGGDISSWTTPGAIVQAQLSNLTPNPSSQVGIDFRQVAFPVNSTANSGRGFLASNAFSVDGIGSIQSGTAYLSPTGTGLTLDVMGIVGSGTPTVAVGGTGYSLNDYLFDTWGGIYRVSGVTAGTVTAVAVYTDPNGNTRQPYYPSRTPPANPIAVSTWGNGLGSGCTLNLTWDTSRTTLSLNPTGKQILTNLAAAATDAAAATAGVPINGLYNNAGVVHVRLT